MATAGSRLPSASIASSPTPSAMKPAPRAKLVAGPAIATRNSLRGSRRFVPEACDAAEQPEGDALDALAAAQRDEGVGELVGEDRAEEEGGREHGRGPVGAAGVGDEVREDVTRSCSRGRS